LHVATIINSNTHLAEADMNTLQIKGNWNLVKGKLKKQFGSLTDNDLLYVEGRKMNFLAVSSKLWKDAGRNS